MFYYEVGYGDNESYANQHKCEECGSVLILLPFDVVVATPNMMGKLGGSISL